jgi:hypothetical protein
VVPLQDKNRARRAGSRDQQAKAHRSQHPRPIGGPAASTPSASSLLRSRRAAGRADFHAPTDAASRISTAGNGALYNSPGA